MLGYGGDSPQLWNARCMADVDWNWRRTIHAYGPAWYAFVQFIQARPRRATGFYLTNTQLIQWGYRTNRRKAPSNYVWLGQEVIKDYDDEQWQKDILAAIKDVEG